ncbi:hypothetical protein EI77_04271 [Prosthecobacter fusiformis]|uniref:Uncharacterized protein n=1 Tax=Prosthecobacter fusiformis TaxID=48464 RepID=A0A4R7RIX1_9BACT|nr:hypothetical protein [Prosthecobacter fusiformis]TDU64087.1 hypothetical protein EI77_04271 [Prosthecobacter fusiformis]
MSSAGSYNSHVGQFAGGPRQMSMGLSAAQFDLPHPPVSSRVMLLIHRALVVAFAKLRSEQGSLAHDIEDAVTVPLYHVLENDLRYRKQRQEPEAIPGFDDTLIESIVRHSGTTDYTLTKLKKEPDIFIKLRPPERGSVLPTDYAIFVECKPVDATHAAGTRYCDDGLIRFANGDYAWAMQEGLMIGYTRHGRSIASHLVPALAEVARCQKLGMDPSQPALQPVPGPTFPLAEPLHVSVHERAFDWAWNKGPAHPIRVYHSWHDCH